MYVQKAIEQILKQMSRQKISLSKAAQKIKNLSHECIQFARLDHHRSFRKGIPEAVYAPGKTSVQMEKIVKRMVLNREPVFVTRLEEKNFRSLKKHFPKIQYSKTARLAYLNPKKSGFKNGSVSIVTAGTSDIPVAEEAAVTLEVLGVKVNRFFDMGVAGLHRLLDHIQQIEKGDVVIVCAGMEGALASVLAGLISKPLIAVPTSVGYGASFKGLAPLLTMMSTCAQGVAVVNIDSGFNAASFAVLLLNLVYANPDDKRTKSGYNMRPKKILRSS